MSNELHNNRERISQSGAVGPTDIINDEHDSGVDIFDTYIRTVKSVDLLTAEEEVELAKQIEAGVYADELLRAVHDEAHPQWKEAMALTDEERALLPQLQAEGRYAKKRMIESNTPLVVFWAKKYNPRGLSLLDIIQEGNLGLIRAVDGFDYKKSVKFSGYASQWIRKYIMQCIANQSRTIRVPAEVYEQANRIKRAKREMTQELGSEPSLEELAAQLQIDPKTIIDLELAVEPLMSLDKSIESGRSDADGDGQSIMDEIAELRVWANTEAAVMHDALQDEFVDLFGEFDEKERTVIEMRHGFRTGEVFTTRKIGRALRIHDDKVRAIEENLMQRLQEKGWLERLAGYLDLYNDEGVA